MANWSNPAGGNWSVTSNWLLSQPPGPGDPVTFVSTLSGPSIIDAAYTNTVLGQINLHVGITLDVERSISTTALNFASGNGTGSDGGLVEVGNGAVLTLASDLVNQDLYIKSDHVGAKGSFVVNGTLQGGGLLTADGVNVDATAGIDDPTGQTMTLLLENGAVYTAGAGEIFDAGTIDIAGSSELNFGALPAGALTDIYGPLAGQQVIMSASNNELVLPNTSDGRSLAISGFGISDKIEIAGVTAVKSATYSANNLNFYSGTGGTGTVLATLTGVTLAAGLPATLNASHFTIGSDTTGSYVLFASCFKPGTHILTPDGEARVEDLREGDLVMTATDAGLAAKPVVWIGRRRIDLTRHPYPWMVSPIRILRGAFADNVPHRDLVLSPDHSIAIDGRLVPTKMLVNGSSIIRETPASIDYLHVECDPHAIILAEGLTVETYLDTGNRAMFQNAGLALMLHPEFAVNQGSRSWAEHACAPLLLDPDEVQPIWQRLRDRAERMSYRGEGAMSLTEEADVQLLANGRRLRPAMVRDGRHIFILPEDATTVTLLSRAGCPAMERPWLGDERQLGVAIREILLRGDAELQVVSADDPALRQGWWDAEHDGVTRWRWTDGAGCIPLPFPARMLEIDIAMTTRYPTVDSGTGLLRAA